jgi:hypothetical protein
MSSAPALLGSNNDPWRPLRAMADSVLFVQADRCRMHPRMLAQPSRSARTLCLCTGHRPLWCLQALLGVRQSYLLASRPVPVGRSSCYFCNKSRACHDVHLHVLAPLTPAVILRRSTWPPQLPGYTRDGILVAGMQTHTECQLHFEGAPKGVEYRPQLALMRPS